MGTINNAFNQAFGAMAGAALAVKHAKDSDFSKMNAADNSALVARNQSREADAVANEAENEANKNGGLQKQIVGAELVKQEAKEALDQATHSKNGSLEERVKKVLKKRSELEEAQKAVDTLRGKQKALEDLQARASEQRRYAAKATKIALDEKTKYENRWGGNK